MVSLGEGGPSRSVENRSYGKKTRHLWLLFATYGKDETKAGFRLMIPLSNLESPHSNRSTATKEFFFLAKSLRQVCSRVFVSSVKAPPPRRGPSYILCGLRKSCRHFGELRCTNKLRWRIIQDVFSF